MAPRPTRDRDALQHRVREAKQKRDQAVETAEREFWTTVGDLSASYHGAQTDAAEELDITPRYVAKQVKRYQ
ncbi:hypothetical protein ABZ686_02360 [Streptomyces sp. NPDC006992]|uniref:hypothetical protein n=1 Tax=Streptomyces sp. NPDC006992 TaxID=3155601 RepID=UPI0033DC8260